MDFLLVIGGLVLLVAGGDILVRGAAALSLRLGIPAIIVGATVVAFGTSAPELLISVQAALEGAPGIAVGNVVGSNIANVLLVLGVPALIVPIAGCGEDARRSLYFMLFATVMFTMLILPGTLTWWNGLVLVAITLVMVGDSIRHGMQLRAANNDGAAAAALADIEDIDPHMAKWKIAAFIVAGIVALPIGAQLLIDGARAVALRIGVSEAAIGLTVVAVGTSLPELATSVMAALRREADVAIGNVVGSNLFNITFIIGAAALVTQVEIPREILARDVWVMIAATAVLTPFVLFGRVIGFWTGAIFVLLYVAYAWLALS